MIKKEMVKKIVAGGLALVLELNSFGAIPLGASEQEDYPLVPGFYDIGYSAPVIEADTNDGGLPVLMYSSIPSSYDSRTYGYVTPIKDQGGFGTCWAFAAVAAMESYAVSHGIVADNTSIDLSEFALAYMTFDDTSFVDNTGTTQGDETSTNNMYLSLANGGNDNYVFKTLSKWAGIVDETTAPYSGAGYTTLEYDKEDVSYILTGQYFINMANVDYVKRTIMENGAVTSYYNADSEYSNTSSEGYMAYYHYTYKEAASNHAIAIIGWDDSIAKENFIILDAQGQEYMPANDGAWLIKNSWGEYWGKDGYMWISYEDKVLSQSTACAYEIAPSSTYGYNYQHEGADIFGYSITFGLTKYANRFDVSGVSKQELRAVSIAVEDDNREYSIQIYHNPSVDDPESGTQMLSEPLTGSTLYAGYYTIPLPEILVVEEGDSFSIVVEFDQETDIASGINGEVSIGGNGVSTAVNVAGNNQSYVGLNGSFVDLYDYYGSSGVGCVNLCIKAFAVDYVDEITASTITSVQSDGESKLTINWQNVKNGITYTLLRATAIDGMYETVYTGTANSYVDTDVEMNTTYYYKVRVYNDEHQALDSYVKSGRVELQTVVLNAIEDKPEGVVLNWNEVAAADGYNVYRSSDGYTYSRIATVQDVTEYCDATAEHFIEYKYYVKAYVLVAEEQKEADASNVLGLSRKVLQFTVSNDSIIEIKLTWLNVSQADGYTIYMGGTDNDGEYDAKKLVANPAAGATSCIIDISNYKKGQDAYFYIEAYKMSGNNKINCDISAASIYLLYEDIQNVKWYVDSYSRLCIKWDEHVSDMTVSRYNVRLYDGPSSNNISTNKFSTTTSTSFYGLSLNQNYYATVVPENLMYRIYAFEQNPRIQVGGAYKTISLKNIADVTYTKGQAVTLTAEITDEMPNFDYKYQWYEAASKTSGGVAINGATKSTYSPDTSSDTEKFYYCVVTGEYNGTKTATSNVVTVKSKDYKINISGATISSVSAQNYTGSAITPAVTVSYGGKTLVKGTDYTVSYSNNVNAGTATITITGKGNYTGTKITTFVINKVEPEKVEPEKNIPDKLTSTIVSVNQNSNVISKIKIGTTVETLLKSMDQKESVVIYSGTNVVSGTTPLATGMIVKIVDGNMVVRQYNVIVTGDINGDAKINVADMMSVKSHILKKSTLSGAYSMAADVNGDGKINVADFMSVKGYILKKNDIAGVAVK